MPDIPTLQGESGKNEVFFPKTNPIVFFRAGDYEAYLDAAKREVNVPFCQHFHENDLISFQFFHNVEKTNGFDMYVVINNVRIHWLDAVYIGSYMPDNITIGTFPTNYYERKDGRGIYCFSRRVSEIRIDEQAGSFWVEGEQLIHDGDKFYFEIRIDANNIFRTNELQCKNDTEGTKLIHYNYSGEDEYYNFSTNFQLMQNGYEIRLPAEFLPITQKANKEIFQTYKGDFELVSALPYETVTLIMGMDTGKGLPDWLIRNLNFIFHLNDKRIDGVRYELVEGSELQVEIIQGYNHRILQIELCKKDDDSKELLDSSGIPIQPIDGGNFGVFVDYINREHTLGTITAKINTDWFFQPITAFEGYSFSTLLGRGTTVINFSVERNTTTDEIVTDFRFVNKDNELIDTVSLTRPPISEGLCVGKLCETFFIQPC